MALCSTKKALFCLLLMAALMLAVYHILLNRKIMDTSLQDRVLHSEAGRLVARSQFDFHHIVEQWVQPGDRKRNPSSRRKERLIEDGRVIKEAFEYGESENERIDKIAQNKLNFHHDQFANSSLRHKANSGKDLKGQHFSESVMVHSRKSIRNGSLPRTREHWLQPDDIKHPQPSVLQNNRNGSIARRSINPISNHVSHKSKNLNGTKSVEVNDRFSDVVNSHRVKTKAVQFANLHVQKSDHVGTADTQVKQPPHLQEMEAKPTVGNQGPVRSGIEPKDSVVNTQARQQPSLDVRPAADQQVPVRSDRLSKGGVVDTQQKQEPQNSELKVKPDTRNLDKVVPVRSERESTQTKEGVLSEKPKTANLYSRMSNLHSKFTGVESQAKYGPLYELKTKPDIKNLQAQVNVRPGSELEAVHSDKLDAINHHEPIVHKQSERNLRAQVPMTSEAKGGAVDTQVKYGRTSKSKQNSSVASQMPVKPGQESNNAGVENYGLLPSEWEMKSEVSNQKMPARENTHKSEGAKRDKHLQSSASKVKKGMTSRNATKLHTAYRPPPGLKAEHKGSERTPRVHVVSVNSRGRTIKVVKVQDAMPLKASGIVKRMNYTKHVTPSHPNTSKNSRSSHSSNPLDQANLDLDLDPRYSHLPAAVKKKLVAIRKNRLKKIQFVRMIRNRCEGKKYCLNRVKSSERPLHDNCFYEAILAEKEGTELKPCQCDMIFTTTRIISVNGHGQTASSTQVSTSQPLVALVSLPGSGNTWVRGLLEQATGYCTGSMWCDPILRAKQFCAEGVRSNTLVVKNHDANIRWLREELAVNSSDYAKPSFASAIFVHRNPYEATIAEWNRALGYMVYNATKHNQTVAGIGYYNVSAVRDQHTITFGKEAFGTNPGWNQTIYRQMENWEAMINHLLVNISESNPVLLVKYEDLKRDAYQEVERMLRFLDVKFKGDMRERLKEGFHAFHRNHTYTFDHYTVEQKIYMNEVINRVSKQLQLHNVDYLHLHKYLRD